MLLSTQCDFCDCRVKPARMSVTQLPVLVFGLRRYMCPHCFKLFWRSWVLFGAQATIGKALSYPDSLAPDTRNSRSRF